MKSITIVNLLIVLIMTCSCAFSESEAPNNWSNKELSEWFRAGEWKAGWAVIPDKTINQRELAVQFFKNRERWEKAFEFLKNTDLGNMEIGRYPLEGDSLFVNVDEYVTKNEADARFEAHKKYADIQYLVAGEEKIGITALENTTEIVPYDGTRDIAFFSASEFNYRTATPANFFIFFPDDAHRPCVKIDDHTRVKKVVVKVKIN